MTYIDDVTNIDAILEDASKLLPKNSLSPGYNFRDRLKNGLCSYKCYYWVPNSKTQQAKLLKKLNTLIAKYPQISKIRFTQTGMRGGQGSSLRFWVSDGRAPEKKEKLNKYLIGVIDITGTRRQMLMKGVSFKTVVDRLTASCCDVYSVIVLNDNDWAMYRRAGLQVVTY